MINRLKSQFEEAINLFIRPPKHEYESEELGKNSLKIKNVTVAREDLSLPNSDQKTLQCSFFRILDENTNPRPCIIYLHCNAGSRCEVLPLLSYLVTININVFSFDMSGCGHSEGDYVTLGYKEALDVKIVAEYLLSTKRASSIGLWGRSMGAVTALKYAEINPNLSVLIVDSPFSNLNKLAHELAKEKTGIPNFLLPMALGLVKKGIKQKVNIKFGALDLTRFVHSLKIPCCFLFSYHDEIIKPYHVEKLFELYGCPEKKLVSVKGRHNDPRPPNILKEVGKFCFDHFIKKDESFKQRMSRYETLDIYKKYSQQSIEKIEKTGNFEHLLKDISSEEVLLKKDSNPNIMSNILSPDKTCQKNINLDWDLPQVDDDLPSVLSNYSLLSPNETKFITKDEFNTSVTSKNSKKFFNESEEEKFTPGRNLSCENKNNGFSPIHSNKETIPLNGKTFGSAEKSFEIKVCMMN